MHKDAYYKMFRNKVISELYTENLEQENIRIPRKFAPKVLRQDAPNIKEHKIAMAIQTVQNDITTMRLHYDIQEKRCRSFEDKIKQFIEQNVNTPERKRKLYADYVKIMSHAIKNIEKKLRDKVPFLNSQAHMCNLPRPLVKDNVFLPQQCVAPEAIPDNAQFQQMPSHVQSQPPNLSQSFLSCPPPPHNEDTDIDDISCDDDRSTPTNEENFLATATKRRAPSPPESMKDFPLTRKTSKNDVSYFSQPNVVTRSRNLSNVDSKNLDTLRNKDKI
jgi:hypothetical protein